MFADFSLQCTENELDEFRHLRNLAFSQLLFLDSIEGVAAFLASTEDVLDCLVVKILAGDL